MAARFSFTEEEMAIDEDLGFPKAFVKICQNPHLFNPYNEGPPFTFIPYKLQTQEAFRARDLNQMFPIIDPERKPSPNPRNYANLLWKQLNHLGNAGFDPAHFRVDPYGNVLYFHADLCSPLAWDIDLWFPCSRGGKSVPSNLRLLQWQVCKRKQNKLEFLIPWWDLQLGISVNQFLSMFASRNADFRNRAFSWLFSDGENEELYATQVVESHNFPQHFSEMRRKVGLAPAAIVSSYRELDVSALKTFDDNRPLRLDSPVISAMKFSAEDDTIKMIQQPGPRILKENNSDMVNNQYAAIAIARDSLRHREAAKKKLEMKKLENELSELKHKNEEERLDLKDLESALLKYKRRAEKCRRLAEAQSSYRDLLEKMIRDAMHQTVVYKEQIRLNQAANNAIMARLEAQRAICDATEKELNRRFKQRDELENQLGPCWEQTRKRSRMDDTLIEERYDKTTQFLPGSRIGKPSRKELRLLLEEQKAYETSLSLSKGKKQEQKEKKHLAIPNLGGLEEDGHLINVDNETALSDKLQKLEIRGTDWRKMNGKKKIYSAPQSPQTESNEEHGQWRNSSQKKLTHSVPQSPQKEDEESRTRRGKMNVDKWLQMLLEDTQDVPFSDSLPQIISDQAIKTDDMVNNMSLTSPQKQTNDSNCTDQQADERAAENNRKMLEKSIANDVGSVHKGVGRDKSFEEKDKTMGDRKEMGFVGCKNSRAFAFRPIPPSSPPVTLGMRRGVDCIEKKTVTHGDDEVEESSENYMMAQRKFFVKSCNKAAKK